jgi:phosphate transport system permease protein
MAAAPAPALRATSPRATWRLTDRLLYGLCWTAGILLCLIVAAIVLYLFVRGIQYLRPDLVFSRPVEGADQTHSGGFLDAIGGTLLITAIGIAIAGPLGVATAIWLTEYARPAWLARAVESAVEIVAGIPSVVFALFGLAVFSEAIFSFLSTSAQGGSAFGRSFLIAGAILSLEALPLVITATRESLLGIPRHVREASYALGKTRAATVRRVLLPSARPGIATGVVLGMGRIIGDTAVIIILLGATLRIEPEGNIPVVDVLRGTGSTLTSYVYTNSPAGEGGAYQKAYAAAFVLLVLVIVLNALVDVIARRREVPQWIR